MVTSSTTRIAEELFLRDEMILFLLLDLGMTEANGPNRSHLCDFINDEMKVPKGSAYCLSGLLVRGVNAVCKKHNLNNTIYQTASTQRFYKHYASKFPQHVHGPGSNALKADFCILQSKEDISKGHAYTLTENERIGQQRTFEYNTNAAGSRNGDGNYQRTRFQVGTASMTYLGAVDVVALILEANPEFNLGKPLKQL